MFQSNCTSNIHIFKNVAMIDEDTRITICREILRLSLHPYRLEYDNWGTERTYSECS